MCVISCTLVYRAFLFVQVLQYWIGYPVTAESQEMKTLWMKACNFVIQWKFFIIGLGYVLKVHMQNEKILFLLKHSGTNIFVAILEIYW